MACTRTPRIVEHVVKPARSSMNTTTTTTTTTNPPPNSILVHCDLGISRSPTIIIAYLMRKYHAKREDVLAFVRSKQKVKPNANFTRQLQIWEQVGYQVWENKERTVPKAPYQAFLDDRAALLRKRGLTGNEFLAPQNL
jgi:dual specificity phosphatase 12